MISAKEPFFGGAADDDDDGFVTVGDGLDVMIGAVLFVDSGRGRAASEPFLRGCSPFLDAPDDGAAEPL